MRKLPVVVAVVLALTLLVTACGGNSSDAHPANVEATFFPSLKSSEKSHAYVYRRTPGEDSAMAKTAAVIFTTDAQGIRVKLKPNAEVVESVVNYTKEFLPTRQYPEWDGVGTLSLTKTIPTSSGGHHQLRVQEVTLMVYDPRFPSSEEYAYSLEEQREEEIRLEKEWSERQREYKEWEREEELEEKSEI